MLLSRSLMLAVLMSAGAAVAQPAQAQSPKAGEVFRDCPDCPQMVAIPPGTFERGSSAAERDREGVPEAFASRELLRAKVTISKPFALGKYEVTRGEFARFVADTKRPIPEECGVHDAKTDSWGEKAGYSWKNTGFKQTDDHPVACISYIDARDFAAWLAKKTGKPYRLASEAEWEYAARAGSTTTRPWGDSAEAACQVQANIMTDQTVRELGQPKSWMNRFVCTSNSSFTVPVGSYPANAFGLHDMIGNIFEYIEDCYHPTYEGAPTDGSPWREADCKQQMVRGGGFHSTRWLARSAFRGGPVVTHSRPVASGIRVARDLP